MSSSEPNATSEPGYARTSLAPRLFIATVYRQIHLARGAIPFHQSLIIELEKWTNGRSPAV